MAVAFPTPPPTPVAALNPPAECGLERGLRLLFLATATVAAALWLWTSFCRFPDEIWNDMRVAAAVAMSRGIDIYPTLKEGVVNTWTYGPLPLVLIQPAALADNAATALVIAGALNVVFILGPLVLVCLRWPGLAGGAAGRPAALVAVVAIIVIWPESPWRCFYADSVAVASGLLSQLMLVRSRGREWLWGAAFLAVAPLACKQTSLGIGVAQVIWLGLTVGRSAALAHFGRCFVAGTLLGLLGLFSFGWAGLSFVLLELPARFGWTDDPLGKIRPLAGPLLIQIVLPAALMLLRRGDFFRRDSPLLLPALTWACSLPMGVAAFLKIGGGLNSFQAFQLWLPATLAVLLGSARFGASARRVLLLAALAGLAGLLRLQGAAFLAFQPRVASIEQGAELARTFPGHIWFPLNPLITLYNENRYYYDEDGIYVRIATDLPLTFGQALPHLPPRWSAIAIRYERDASWGVAENMIPKEARRAEFGVWKLSLWGVLDPGTPPDPPPPP